MRYRVSLLATGFGCAGITMLAGNSGIGKPALNRFVEKARCVPVAGANVRLHECTSWGGAAGWGLSDGFGGFQGAVGDRSGWVSGYRLDGRDRVVLGKCANARRRKQLRHERPMANEMFGSNPTFSLTPRSKPSVVSAPA